MQLQPALTPTQQTIDSVAQLISRRNPYITSHLKPSTQSQNHYILTVQAPYEFIGQKLLLQVFETVVQIINIQKSKQPTPFVLIVFQKQAHRYWTVNGLQIFQKFNKSAIKTQINLAKLFWHTTLNTLYTLRLQKCKLSNIEFLTFLDAPNLHELSLQENYIIDFKPIRKCYLPSLTCYKIDKNLSSQLILQRTKTHKSFRKLQFEGQRSIFQDLNKLAKFQLSLLGNTVSIGQTNRIIQPKLAQALARKYFLQHKGRIVELKWINYMIVTA